VITLIVVLCYLSSGNELVILVSVGVQETVLGFNIFVRVNGVSYLTEGRSL